MFNRQSLLAYVEKGALQSRRHGMLAAEHHFSRDCQAALLIVSLDIISIDPGEAGNELWATGSENTAAKADH